MMKGFFTLLYSFLHQIPIGIHDEKEFEQLVKKAPLAGNVDNPEGSLDALLQVRPIYINHYINLYACPSIKYEGHNASNFSNSTPN